MGLFGNGLAPRVARRGAGRSRFWGRGRPWLEVSALILSRVRSRALGCKRLGSRAKPLCGVAPVGTRGAVGLEAEVGGRRLRGEHGALVQDDEAAIEQFPELDATAGVGALVGAGRELDPAGPEVDRVVAGDPARIATAEDEGEIARGAAPGRGPPRPGSG